MKKKQSIQALLALFLIFLSLTKSAADESDCVDAWEADLSDPTVELCPVKTEDNEPCQFPFTDSGVTYRTCTINGANNPERLPRCKIASGNWAVCILPTNAVVSGVTTRKAGPSYINGASLAGGTLVWITGKRFAPMKLSTSPATDTSNHVILTNDFSSYPCDIHPDATTTTQITCFTHAMTEGKYRVQVIVEGNIVPVYQYTDPENAKVTVSLDNTPIINRFEPSEGLPGTFVDIGGDFKTYCYTRDTDGCSDDSGARITRVYVGGQQCQLIDKTTNELYSELTQRSMRCRLDKPEIGYFTVSMLVNNEFGRSKTSSKLLFVSPDQKLYNFQTYAQVDSISPQTGSKAGGTHLTITGKYLYTDSDLPAVIDIAGQPCNVIDFDMSDLNATRIVCETPAEVVASADNYGNRGITLIKETVATNAENLATAVPSNNAEVSILDKATFTDTGSAHITVWLKGFIYPRVNSTYQFSVVTNGVANLFISSDSSSANKQKVADNVAGGSVELIADTYYYIETIASRLNGKLQLAVNAKLEQTILTDDSSSFVQNEVQKINISSTKIPEAYTIEQGVSSDTNFTNTTDSGVIQTLLVSQINGEAPFQLSFYGVKSVLIAFGASAKTLQDALNDMPLLQPDHVKVEENIAEDGVNKIYSVHFSGSLGKVPDLNETLGLVNVTIQRINEPSLESVFSQVVVDGVPSELFNLVEDSAEKVQDSIEKSFSIRCPASISVNNMTNSFATFDYEENCEWDNKPIEDSAYCGKCASRSSILFNNLNSTLNYKYACFAYKITSAVTTLYGQFVDPLLKTLTPFKSNINLAADNTWHYTCLDLEAEYQNIKLSGSYPLSKIKLYSLGLSPSNPDMLIDIVSVRKDYPLGVSSTEEMDLLNSRRLMPTRQYTFGSFVLTKSDTSASFSYTPTNCTSGLSDLMLLSGEGAFDMSKDSAASKPVEGTFSLSWNGHDLNDIPSDISELDLSALLQSISGFGNAQVTRSGDCSGYTYQIKWLSGGDKPAITLLSNTLSGNQVAISVTTITDGGALFNPIRGEMLRTYHSKPQVSITIADIVSECTECTFEWLESATPTVSNIDASNLDSIQITGSNFDASEPNQNVVLIGEIPCEIVSATSTLLVCSAGQNPIGTYSFRVNVLSKGLAVMNSDVKATFSFTALSVTPNSGSTGGGNLLNITGRGFNSDCYVSVDSNVCEIVFVDYGVIICRAPSSDIQTNTNVDVSVTDMITGSVSTLSAAYLYDFESTPVVSSVNPTILSVLGGQIVTAFGNNLPVFTSGIKFGEVEVSVLTTNSTHLIIRSPSLPPGLYKLNILIEGLGMVKVNSQIEYKLFVSSFTPRIGSIRGGSLVTVYGEGFSTECQLNQVAFGTQRCKVIECNEQWLTCRTLNAYTTYKLNNDGSDPYHGKGYAWSKPHLTINVGESVQWTWQPPTGINTVKFGVFQTADPISFKQAGFGSGPQSPIGSFTYQFNQPGIYYYSSGYVEATKQIVFRGVVEVVDSQDKELEINYHLGNIEASKCHFPFTYKNVEYTDCTADDSAFSWCSPTDTYTGLKLPCEPQSQPQAQSCPGIDIDQNTCGVTSPTSRYNMKFTTCANSLPSITSLSSSRITYEDSLTITGTGFSTTECENQVLIGGIACNISSSSATEIVCQLGPQSGLFANFNYNIEVLVSGKGYALQNDNFHIQFTPRVDSLSLSTGSVAGGTRLIISGDGFIPESTLVVIGQIPYYNNRNGVYMNSTHIVLNTVAHEDATLEVLVIVNKINASCDTCSFTYSDSISPSLTSVTPLNVSGPTKIILEGFQFGSDPEKVSVFIGKSYCSIISLVNESQIECDVDAVEFGEQLVQVIIDDIGLAKTESEIIIKSELQVDSVSPSQGSVHGGTLVTVTGNGFDSNTQIYFGDYPCLIKSFEPGKITCRTSNLNLSNKKKRSAESDEALLLVLINNVQTFTSQSVTFTYETSSSPSVTSISPSSGSGGQLTIAGSNFGTEANSVTVKVSQTNCVVVSVSDNQVICELESGSAGSHPVTVNVAQIGDSNMNIQYKYLLSVSSLSKNEGSIGGGLSLEISGGGFSNSTSVTICGRSSKITKASLTSLTCILPDASVKNEDSTCVVSISENGQTATSSFTYKLALTPSIQSSSPARGGTGGGTLLTITGSGFPTDQEIVQVKIAGAICDISAISSTQILCRTGSFGESSQKAIISVEIVGSGLALNKNLVSFEYIDLWSSRFTWGGNASPGEGEIAVIGPNQHIYFDAASTPILKGIIIQGGSLIFDDNQDVSLNVEYILIIGAGKFEVGTEQKPFQHQANITMYGHIRSPELPIFGSKVIAVRNGTLDLHGRPIGVTWTHLGVTATAGSNTVTLKESVFWPINSQIIIATTGDKFSPGESEQRRVISKSADNRTLTLNEPLQFEHLSVIREVGSDTDRQAIEIRAEVGLLSRNIVFRGHNDETWNILKTAEACPAGFNPAEFATQTCFLGRYGPELGSDEFGGIIFIGGGENQPKGIETVKARFSNVELTHVGQAFRLGRYPIHFHRNGDMPSSYVRECAIHKSFNRAVNVHASNYVTIERTVIYNIMGGAYFLEDGVEIGTTFKNNLAVFVRTSSSLLNEDVTPAAFWATNPNNTWINNAVAGSTHFGWWYRILDHPEGPSFTLSYCPKKIPFGKFGNNSVHSTGRFGLWIFPGYTPTVSGGCNDIRPSVAQFNNFTSWSCDKGAENVNSNNIQFKNMRLWDHFSTAIDTKIIKGNDEANSRYKNTWDDENLSTMVKDVVIVGNTINGKPAVGQSGLTLGWDRGELIKNIKFYNFPNQGASAIDATSIAGKCTVKCGGWTNEISGLTFNNVLYRTSFRWNWDFILKDMDGSLTGKAGNIVMPKDNHTDSKSYCRLDQVHKAGAVCLTDKTQIRFAFKEYTPSFALTVLINNSLNAQVFSEKLGKRLTHKPGMMATVEANDEYTIYFKNTEAVSNMSYSGTWYGFLPGEYLIIKHPLKQKPDQVSFGQGLLDESLTPLSVATSKHGDWYWDNSTRTVNYLLKNVDVKPFQDFAIKFSAIKCRYVGCKPPESPGLRAPVTSRPANALMWSNSETWKSKYFIRSKRSANTGIPEDGDSILIPDGEFIVVDVPLPKLKLLQIEGVLELDNGIDHTLEADLIFINGGQLIVGWENNPILTNVKIVLNGFKNSLRFFLPNGLENIGGKGIGVYGGLDIHGKPRDVTWTKLQTTASSGDDSIVLVNAVDWKVGEQVTITTTSFILEHNEVMTIAAVSEDKKTLTFTDSLKFEHLAFTEQFDNGQNYKISAAVGLLTRNVKIIGSEYPTQEADLYGFRILVSDYSIVINDFLTYYKGFARISNCEMVHPGQFSRNSGEDAQYGVLISNQGEFNKTRPTYIKSSSFHHGFGVAIGILSSDGIPIENNVIHKVIDFGIRVEGKNNLIRRNLIASHYWGSTYLTSEARSDITYWGAIDTSQSESATVEDNFVSGSERVAYNTRGDVCSGKGSLDAGLINTFKRNTAHGAGVGISIEPRFAYKSISCIQVSEFTAFKSQYYGIYYQSNAEFSVNKVTLVDNQIGVFQLILGDPPQSHVVTEKKYIVKNSLIVGRDPYYSCDNDRFPKNISDSFGLFNPFGAGKNKNGRVGLLWPTFTASSNKMPLKPWTGMMAYNQIGGEMIIKNVTFAHFESNSCNQPDTVFINNVKNDDGQHPIQISESHLFNVDNSSKVFLHRPNLGKINPSDCVDMDCDGLKKNLMNDIDGSFLGSPGTVFSQSEFGWGSQQRGLGDFRIPMAMLSDAQGHLITPSKVYNEPGIVRDNSLCTRKDEWQAWECHGLDYQMLIIESMDKDTEDRRLSPVAILSDNKYLDLINGPQDHGWCFGYTCQKRISTFMAIVAANKNYDIVLTSTPPEKLRFTLLNSNSSFKIGLSMFYSTAQRVDLYKNDEYVPPTNAYFDNDGNMRTNEINANTLASLKPTWQNVSGSNLHHRKKIYFSTDGSSVIDLKIAPVLFVSFGLPAITPEEFFNEDTIVGNMALLLGVEPSKIRRVEIVRATRRRRSVPTENTVSITMADDASPDISNEDNVAAQKLEMQKLSATISNMFMTGVLQQNAQAFLNITITGLTVQPPASNTTAQPLSKINDIKVITQASGCSAQVPCSVQPKLQVIDENGNAITNIGSVEFPWVVEAKLTRANKNTTSLILQTEANVINGVATFTKLGVSEIDSGIVISYNFKLPEGLNASNFDTKEKVAPPISASLPVLTCDQSGAEIVADENRDFSLVLAIIDKKSKEVVENISFNNYAWSAIVSLHNLGYHKASGSLVTTNATVEFDQSTGLATFSTLSITKRGMYLLAFNVKTAGNEFNFKCISKQIIIKEKGVDLPTYTADPTLTTEPNYILKFEGDYSEIVPGEVKANLYNFMANYNIDVSGITVYSGSVYTSFYSDSTSSSLINTLTTRGVELDSKLRFSHATVNDRVVSCTSCTIIVQEQKKPETTITSERQITAIAVGAIVGAVVGSIIGVVVLLLVLWGIKEYKKVKVRNLTVSPGSGNIRIAPEQKGPLQKLLQKLTSTTKNDYVKEEMRSINDSPMPIIPKGGYDL